MKEELAMMAFGRSSDNSSNIDDDDESYSLSAESVVYFFASFILFCQKLLLTLLIHLCLLVYLFVYIIICRSFTLLIIFKVLYYNANKTNTLQLDTLAID